MNILCYLVEGNWEEIPQSVGMQKLQFWICIDIQSEANALREGPVLCGHEFFSS